MMLARNRMHVMHLAIVIGFVAALPALRQASPQPLGSRLRNGRVQICAWERGAPNTSLGTNGYPIVAIFDFFLITEKEVKALQHLSDVDVT